MPEGTAFATKPALALVARAIAANVPFAFVAADTLYEVDDIEMALRRAGKGTVLGVKSDHAFNSWAGKPLVAGTAEAIADGLAPSAWMRLSAGEGSKGARLYDRAYCEPADLNGAGDDQTGLWTRGLLIRRGLTDGERACFTTWCKAGTPVATLVAVEGHRCVIEDGFETAKNELGLDHNETRSWHGWHRHVTLAMLAFALLAVIRHHANAPPPKSRSRPKAQPGPRARWSVQDSRRIAVRLAQQRLQPAHTIAWLIWRRAHRAVARNAHLNPRALDARRRKRRRTPRNTARTSNSSKTQL